LVYVVLDEFPLIPTSGEPELGIHGVFSRDRRFVSVETVWLRQSPGRRRLRFSFQINDVKDRDRLPPTPPVSPGGCEERLSSRRPPWCQPILSDFFCTASFEEFGAKNAVGRRGASLNVSATIRLRLGNLAFLRRISRVFFELSTSPWKLRPRAGSGVFSCLTPPSQSAVSSFFHQARCSGAVRKDRSARRLALTPSSAELIRPPAVLDQLSEVNSRG